MCNNMATKIALPIAGTLLIAMGIAAPFITRRVLDDAMIESRQIQVGQGSLSDEAYDEFLNPFTFRDYYLYNFTNVNEALTTGAKLEVLEVGPMRFQAFFHRFNLSYPNVNGTDGFEFLVWSEYVFRSDVPQLFDLDNAIVSLNAAYIGGVGALGSETNAAIFGTNIAMQTFTDLYGSRFGSVATALKLLSIRLYLLEIPNDLMMNCPPGPFDCTPLYSCPGVANPLVCDPTPALIDQWANTDSTPLKLLTGEHCGTLRILFHWLTCLFGQTSLSGVQAWGLVCQSCPSGLEPGCVDPTVMGTRGAFESVLGLGGPEVLVICGYIQNLFNNSITLTPVPGGEEEYELLSLISLNRAFTLTAAAPIPIAGIPIDFSPLNFPTTNSWEELSRRQFARSDVLGFLAGGTTFGVAGLSLIANPTQRLGNLSLLDFQTAFGVSDNFAEMSTFLSGTEGIEQGKIHHSNIVPAVSFVDQAVVIPPEFTFLNDAQVLKKNPNISSMVQAFFSVFSDVQLTGAFWIGTQSTFAEFGILPPSFSLQGVDIAGLGIDTAVCARLNFLLGPAFPALLGAGLDPNCVNIRQFYTYVVRNVGENLFFDDIVRGSAAERDPVTGIGILTNPPGVSAMNPNGIRASGIFGLFTLREQFNGYQDSLGLALGAEEASGGIIGTIVLQRGDADEAQEQADEFETNGIDRRNILNRGVQDFNDARTWIQWEGVTDFNTVEDLWKSSCFGENADFCESDIIEKTLSGNLGKQNDLVWENREFIRGSETGGLTEPFHDPEHENGAQEYVVDDRIFGIDGVNEFWGPQFYSVNGSADRSTGNDREVGLIDISTAVDGRARNTFTPLNFGDESRETAASFVRDFPSRELQIEPWSGATMNVELKLLAGLRISADTFDSAYYQMLFTRNSSLYLPVYYADERRTIDDEDAEAFYNNVYVPRIAAIVVAVVFPLIGVGLISWSIVLWRRGPKTIEAVKPDGAKNYHPALAENKSDRGMSLQKLKTGGPTSSKFGDSAISGVRSPHAESHV
eukprot:jgi/Bigna1/66446/fgenesh1_pg.1_\